MRKKVLLIGGNSLVGQSIIAGLGNSHQIIPTAGHHAPENGHQLMVKKTNKLVEILASENPEIVIVSFTTLPARKEIPDNLQITVSDVLSTLKQLVKNQ